MKTGGSALARMLLVLLTASAAVLTLGCQNPLLTVGFGDKVDITEPAIRLSDAAGDPINGDYASGLITIRGSSSDDIGVASVSYSFTDGAGIHSGTAELDAAKKNWWIEDFNTALYEDGEKQFVFTVEDGSGKVTTTQMLLVFDNSAPIALVNLPASETDLVNGDVRLSGEAYDPYGVTSVSVAVYDVASGGSPLISGSADGTSTWNFTVVSLGLTATSGTYWFQVTVEDRAGNTSEHQYLYSDIFAANGDNQITIDKLSLLEAGTQPAGVYIDPADTDADGPLWKTRQQLLVDQDSDKPTFIVSSPQPSDVVGFYARAVGVVEDDDGVRNGASDIRVHVWKSGGTPDFGWGNATPSGSGISVRFSYALDMISTSGDYLLEVEATDINGTSSTSNPIPFTVDAGVPAATIDPVARVYFNQSESLALTGTAQSIGGSVDAVELTLGSTTAFAALASPGAESTTWTCSFPLAGISEGNKTLVAEAIDGAKTGSTNLFLIMDNTAPQASFISPTNGATVYSLVTLRGTSSDNTSLAKVELRLGKLGPSLDGSYVEMTGSLYDWVKDFLSNDYANSSQSTDQGDGTWSMPIFCRLTDIAGNIATNDPTSPHYLPAKVPVFTLIIDLDRDKPTITIQNPRDATNVAGTVVASGSCFDESPGMSAVEIRIAALRDDDSLIGYVTPDGAALGTNPDTSWVNVPWVGGQRSYWQQSINENEQLYDVGAAGGAYPGETHHGKLELSVRPIDLGSKVGNAQTVRFRLDDTIPRLETPRLTINGVDYAAADYLYARGTITLTATARDDSAVDSIKLSLNGGSSYGSELIGGAYVTWISDAEYDIAYPIDTLTDTQIPLATRTAKNGLLTMGVKVQDDSTPAPYVNTWFVTLNLDNLYPTTSYTGTSGNGHDPMELAGNRTSSAQVMGTSTDTGSVSGIDRVEVYLVRAGKVIRLSDGDEARDVETQLFGDPAVAADYTTSAAHKAVIDWTKVGAVDNMALVQNGSDVDWWAKLDTTVIADGDLTINWVAWDKAGNAVHGSQAGFIRNNVPVISSVSVGTDLNASGVVDAGEISPYNPASPITARNNLLYLKINTSTVGMNTPFAYSIVCTTPTGDATNYGPTGEATITTTGLFGGDGDGKVFTVKITDAVGIEVEQTVTVNIHNTDATLPTISVNPLADPADLLDWTLAPVAGHIETSAESRYDNSGTTDADVSGTVMVRGSAHDNVRIDAITLSIDGAAAFQVAHWGTTGLVEDAAEFNISSETLDDSGHDVTFDYKWNSALITTTAKNNVVLSFVATDHSSNPSVAGTRQYDVVPYITQIDTAVTGYISKDFNRSALGKYPVRTGETITVKGYNLRPTQTGVAAGNSDVRVVSLANRDQTLRNGRGLVYAGVASPYTSFTATISTLATDASIGSGYLVVWVNGVPSINALSGRSNAETNFVSATGTDERWLAVWDLTVFKTAYAAAAPNANHAVYPSMVMSGNTPHFAYANNSQGYGLAEYWNGTTETKIYENWDLFTYTGICLNSSGSYAALYDINVVYNGTNFVGDKGGILTSFFYTPANSVWSSSARWYRDYHIWLDNLYHASTLAVLGRYQYPDFKVTGNDALTRVYTSLYDSINDQVLARAFNVGTNSGSVGSTNKITDNTTNGVASPNLYTNIAQYNQSAAWPAYTDGSDVNNRRFDGGDNDCGQSPPNAYVIATGAGPWTAVAATSGGVQMVVWYATATNELKYAYNTTPSVAGGGTFTGTITLDSFCGGDFVDMIVDASDHVHIAWHDSYSGDLLYAYLPTYNGALEGPYVVDSYLTIGNKMTIALSAAGVPYLSYKGMGNTAKAAWLVGARGDGVDANDKFNGAWEVQVLPTRIVDNDTNRFCTGVDSNALPVVGYTNDGIEYIRRLADLP